MSIQRFSSPLFSVVRSVGREEDEVMGVTWEGKGELEIRI